MNSGLFSGGPRGSRIVRVLLWLGWMAGCLIAFFAGGHTLRTTSMAVSLFCLAACAVEYLRANRKGNANIEPLNMKGRSR